MKHAHTQLCVSVAAIFLAAGGLQAANKVVVQDAHCNKTAVTYPLPAGWQGNGDVKWNAEAKHQGTMCVRTMEIVDKGDEITIHYISAFDSPLSHGNPSAKELAAKLMPAVTRMPGKQGTELATATLYKVPQDLAEFRMARDHLSRRLGKKINGKVYAVAAVCSDGTVIGAIVHERSERKLLRTARTISFHDICILSSEQGSPKQALQSLKNAATNADFNQEWISDQIRITANNLDGMTKIDEKALPQIADKAEERMKLGLPTVIDCMYDAWNKRYSTRGLAHSNY